LTLDDLDAELAHMRAHLRWLVNDAIEECEAELEVETNPYRREFVQAQLIEYQAMRERHEHAA
jgi:hypothetical protein